MKYAVIIKGKKIDPEFGIDPLSVYSNLKDAESAMRSRNIKSKMLSGFGSAFDAEWEVVNVSEKTLNEFGRTGYMPIQA
jgi:hypothetical protein